MDWAAAAQTATDVTGDIVTNALNYSSARQNREMQMNLANTAHQREVRDLRAAGLNPILSAMGGKGANVPQLQAPQVDIKANPVRSYLEYQDAKSRIDLTKEEKERVKEQKNTEISTQTANSAAAYRSMADANFIEVNAKKAAADAENSSAMARKNNADAKLAELEVAKQKIVKDVYNSVKSPQGKKLMSWMEYLKQLWKK